MLVNIRENDCKILLQVYGFFTDAVYRILIESCLTILSGYSVPESFYEA